MNLVQRRCAVARLWSVYRNDLERAQIAFDAASGWFFFPRIRNHGKLTIFAEVLVPAAVAPGHLAHHGFNFWAILPRPGARLVALEPAVIMSQIVNLTDWMIIIVIFELHKDVPATVVA